MAKLYWRIKRNGKWTWEAATPENSELEDEEYLRDELTYNRVSLFQYMAYIEPKMDKPEVYTDGE